VKDVAETESTEEVAGEAPEGPSEARAAEGLRAELMQINKQLVAINGQFRELETRRNALRCQMVLLGKRLQAMRAQATKARIAAGGDEQKTRPRKAWQKKTNL